MSVSTPVASGPSTLVDLNFRKDVDILFMIDNSPSMSPKQNVLAQAIPQFIQAIEATNVNYQIGIVTSDLGFNVPNGTATGQPFPGPLLTSCNTAAGDDGVLQNIACPNRTGLAGEAASACATLCPDPRFVPNSGGRFIAKQNGITNVPVMMKGGVDIGPQLAFQCMALVGDIGCGIEMQLESVKRALDNHRPDNTGFNRGTSSLAVIFITDEDDCSVQLAKRNLLDPATPNEGTAACTTPTATPGVNLSCFNDDYRCIASDVTCNQPLNTPGQKSNCSERADSIMTSIRQYVDFFSSLPNPNVILSGIWSPTMLDNVTSDPAKPGQFNVDNVDQGTGTAPLNRGHLSTEAACYTQDPMHQLSINPFLGQAQLRLSSFIRSFNPNHISEHSICDATSGMNGGYTQALGALANNIASSLTVDCLGKAPLVQNGVPECTVGYVPNAQTAPTTALPVCSPQCCNYFATDSQPKAAYDPNLSPNSHLQAKQAACSSDPDCYCAIASTANACSGGVVAGVWRPGNAPQPPGTVVSFQCKTAP